MTLAWTPTEIGSEPPAAILSLYCPTDYEDKFWRQPNIPQGSEEALHSAKYNLLDGTFSSSLASYDIPTNVSISDGWMALGDARSMIPLHMNWHGQALHVLLHGMKAIQAQSRGENLSSLELTDSQIAAISPLAQVRRGNYRTPTYLIHGTGDDLIPWQQSQRTVDALVDVGVEAQVDVVEGAPHLFDVFHAKRDRRYEGVVRAGVEFLRRHI
jgi:acetyl esterase/lipase